MKKFVLVSLVLLLPLELLAQSDSKENKDRIPAADAVQILINDAEYENAIARVEAALKKDKKNPVLLLQRGLILVKLDRLQDAKTHYKKIKRKIKNNAEPGNNLAIVYRLEGKYFEAVKEFKNTIRKYPDYAPAYENLGDTYVEMAQKQFQLGLEKQPDNPVLASKLDLGSNFSEVAKSNTPAAKRRALAEQAEVQQPASPEVTPATTSSAVSSATTEDEVMGVLGSWISSWSDRNLDDYLSHYSSDYQPQYDIPLPEWIGRKSEAISRAKFIRIKLDEIRLSQIDSGKITATFKQFYESDTLVNRSIKSVTLQRYDDKWLIISEESRTTG